MTLAALPMYDWPEVRDATDGLWAALRPKLAAIGLDPPEALTRARPAAEVWGDRDLVFAQTCGLPYVAGAARAARIIAAPVYEAEGCGGGTYSSALVARRDGPASEAALHGARFAANGPDSLSGWAALVAHLGGDAIGAAVWTGSHRASVVAVAEGRADAAAIDAVAWDLALRFEPAAAELRVLGWTEACAAPPFVASALIQSGDRARIRAALVNVLVDPETAPLRAALRLNRIVAFADTDYDAARKLARKADAVAAARPDLLIGA